MGYLLKQTAPSNPVLAYPRDFLGDPVAVPSGTPFQPLCPGTTDPVESKEAAATEDRSFVWGLPLTTESPGPSWVAWSEVKPAPAPS